MSPHKTIKKKTRFPRLNHLAGCPTCPLASYSTKVRDPALLWGISAPCCSARCWEQKSLLSKRPLFSPHPPPGLLACLLNLSMPSSAWLLADAASIHKKIQTPGLPSPWAPWVARCRAPGPPLLPTTAHARSLQSPHRSTYATARKPERAKPQAHECAALCPKTGPHPSPAF